MNKGIKIISFLLLFFPFYMFSQGAYHPGEWFQFRVHYGLVNAGYATIEVSEKPFNGKDVFHVVGKGWSTGAFRVVFKVDDNYETFIDPKTGFPVRFIRQIDEGGYTKDVQIDFDHNLKKAYVTDNKNGENFTYTIPTEVQDLLSAFYYLRNDLNNKQLVPGQEFKLNMFYGEEVNNFKVKFIGREVIKTKFGKVTTLKFRPYVLTGRIFKEQESLTFWVTDDDNKMPVKVKAKLAVGSLSVSLDQFKNLKHPLSSFLR